MASKRVNEDSTHHKRKRNRHQNYYQELDDYRKHDIDQLVYPDLTPRKHKQNCSYHIPLAVYYVYEPM